MGTDEEQHRGEYGGIVDAHGRELLVNAIEIDGEIGVTLQPLSLGSNNWRTVVQLDLCAEQVDMLIGDLLRVRRQAQRDLDRERYNRYREQVRRARAA